MVYLVSVLFFFRACCIQISYLWVPKVAAAVIVLEYEDKRKSKWCHIHLIKELKT